MINLALKLSEVKIFSGCSQQSVQTDEITNVAGLTIDAIAAIAALERN